MVTLFGFELWNDGGLCFLFFFLKINCYVITMGIEK